MEKATEKDLIPAAILRPLCLRVHVSSEPERDMDNRLLSALNSPRFKTVLSILIAVMVDNQLLRCCYNRDIKKKQELRAYRSLFGMMCYASNLWRRYDLPAPISRTSGL